MELQQILTCGLNEAGLELEAQAQAGLLDYVALLVKWNRVYNLTSVRKPQDMLTRHILDSLVVLPYVKGPRVLDVGTGAGLPGLVLAIARPQWQVVLLDSSNKKLRFVRQAISDLALDNATVEHVRIEDYRPAALFDTIISRAFSSLGEMHTHCARLCAADGHLLAMKGVYPLAEVESLSDPGVVLAAHALRVPGLDAQRHLLELRPS
ncbi:MAG: 16S rRNA (guanine(527)-N(7))-methyltransferase RsmG [Gammaproteobacteria bacterium]